MSEGESENEVRVRVSMGVRFGRKKYGVCMQMVQCGGRSFHSLTYLPPLPSPLLPLPSETQPKEGICRLAKGGNGHAHYKYGSCVYVRLSLVCYSSCPVHSLHHGQAIEASIVQIFFNVRAGQSDDSKDRLAKVCSFPAPPHPSLFMRRCAVCVRMCLFYRCSTSGRARDTSLLQSWSRSTRSLRKVGVYLMSSRTLLSALLRVRSGRPRRGSVVFLVQSLVAYWCNPP